MRAWPEKLRSENANRMRRIARVISDLILMKEKVFGLAQKVRDRATGRQNSELELRTRRATFEGGILLGLIHRHGSFNQSAINHSLQQTKNENMSSSTKHELLYFDGAGRAETIRMIFHRHPLRERLADHQAHDASR